MSLCQLTPRQFVEKYKLVPKMLREKMLAFVYQLPTTTSSTEMFYDDTFDDAFMYLRAYECWNKEEENYEELITDLEDNVYLGPSDAYRDIANKLMTCMRWKKKIVTADDVYIFRKNLMLRDIKDIVAYRFGNVGYERVRDHFYSICGVY